MDIEEKCVSGNHEIRIPKGCLKDTIAVSPLGKGVAGNTHCICVYIYMYTTVTPRVSMLGVKGNIVK
jgi:hypothetical protein